MYLVANHIGREENNQMKEVIKRSKMAKALNIVSLHGKTMKRLIDLLTLLCLGDPLQDVN